MSILHMEDWKERQLCIYDKKTEKTRQQEPHLFQGHVPHIPIWRPHDDNAICICRECDDVFAAEILDPYCKFCYAKKFKMSAINIQDILEIAPTDAYCI